MRSSRAAANAAASPFRECAGDDELDEVKTSSPVVKRPSVTPLLETPETGTPDTPTSTNPLTKDEAKSDPEFDNLVDIELSKRQEPANVETGEPVSPRAVPEATAKRKVMTWPRVFFRLGVVLGTFLAAVAVPDLGALIALLGALTGSILSLIAPALINRRCPREKGGWECVADGMTILIGVVGGTLGTYQAFLNVVNGGDISE